MDIQWVGISIGFGHGHNFFTHGFFHGRAKTVFMYMDMDLILFNPIQTRPIAILRQAPMDPLLLCGAPRLSLCGAPTVSPCSEPQPIGADAPSLLCGVPSIMLCGELQHVGADMPILIRGAQAPCAKGLLNPGDDVHHSVVHRVAGELLGLDRP